MTLCGGRGAEQNPFLAHPVDDVGRRVHRGLERDAILHQLDAEEQPRAANVPNQAVSLAKRAEPLEQPCANPAGVSLEIVALDDVEDGQADRARDRAAAEGAEELHPVVERGGNLTGRDDGAERIAVADRLPEHDDVRNDAVSLEGVEMRAHPAVRALDFVGNAHAARGPHVIVDGSQIPLRQQNLPRHAGTRFRDEGTQPRAGPAGMKRRDRAGDAAAASLDGARFFVPGPGRDPNRRRLRPRYTSGTGATAPGGALTAGPLNL